MGQVVLAEGAVLSPSDVLVFGTDIHLVHTWPGEAPRTRDPRPSPGDTLLVIGFTLCPQNGDDFDHAILFNNRTMKISTWKWGHDVTSFRLLSSYLPGVSEEWTRRNPD